MLWYPQVFTGPAHVRYSYEHRSVRAQIEDNKLFGRLETLCA